MITIAVDAMGGDHGLRSTIPGVLKALAAQDNFEVILVGQEDAIHQALKKHKSLNHPRIKVVAASEVVTMDESPSQALRNKKNSSMRVAINLVKEAKAQACVSSGNTGALMATARFVLKTLPGIDRPAIIYAVPGVNPLTHVRTLTHMLDLGANVDCSSDHLYQFACMASIRTQLVDGIAKPRVALLNIGEEEIKGLETIKEAAKKLSANPVVNYIGFVEGNDIFNDKADVIVCDGFIGNIALKTMEGTAKFIAYIVKDAFKSSWFAKVLAIFALPILAKIKHNLDVRQYNGASFLGLKGIVIKSHGGADAYAFSQAILAALHEIEHNLPAQIAALMAPSEDAADVR